jgi:hypothetical protein
MTTDSPADHDWLTVLLRHDRIYKHNIMRVNYTTYDVRRAQDVIHPASSHCNVMVLNPNAGDSAGHPFWYARVLGIYHANIVYTGLGTVDYLPRRLEFLWVRWYHADNLSVSWATGSLDRVRFPPMSDEDSFGFLNPADVLRGCHVIPAFARGKARHDGLGISRCACDSKDWQAYYVNR